MNNEELKKNLALLDANRNALAHRYHVSRAGIFGSIARGTQTPSSDIDVLVEFSEPIGLFSFLELEDFLGALFQKKSILLPNKH